jgi:hypothetical protein
LCADANSRASPLPTHLFERSRLAMGSELRLIAWTTNDAAAQ